MKIIFVLPSAGCESGGARVVFEYANRLKAMGHDSIVVGPRRGSLFPEHSKFRALLSNLIPLLKNIFIKRTDSNYFDVHVDLLSVPDLAEGYIPDADVIIATAWRTAGWVNSYSRRKGDKFYLIQHYEIWDGPKEMVEATYKLPLKKIVIASWLKELIENGFSEKVAGTIINGVNLEMFYNDHKVFNSPRRVCMAVKGADWKGVDDGVRAFEIAKKNFPDIRLVMFGRKKTKVPDYAEFHLRPTQEEIRKIYCSSDIFVSPSWTEGCQLPPMEAMACKCAVAATNVGGIPDYTIPGKTALVSPPKDPAALAENISRLLRDEELLKRISFAGHEKIKEFTWDRAVGQLEKLLIDQLAS